MAERVKIFRFEETEETRDAELEGLEKEINDWLVTFKNIVITERLQSQSQNLAGDPVIIITIFYYETPAM